MRSRFLFLVVLAGLFVSCKDEGSTKTETTATTEQQPVPPKSPESDLGKEQTGELMNVLSAYYSLKDALVATDATQADQSASKLLSAAEMFNAGLGDQPQYAVVKEDLKNIMTGSEAIVAVKAADIEKKRAHFSKISDATYKMVKGAHLKNAGLYQQFCPMAFNDKGGYWLSTEAEIKNPYFGKKMMECGEVRDSL